MLRDHEQTHGHHVVILVLVVGAGSISFIPSEIIATWHNVKCILVVNYLTLFKLYSINTNKLQILDNDFALNTALYFRTLGTTGISFYAHAFKLYIDIELLYFSIKEGFISIYHFLPL